MPKKGRGLRTVDILLIAVIGLMVGAFIGMEVPSVRTAGPEPGAFSVSLPVPAVDSHGQGVATNLVVESRNGTGKTLANIDVLLFWVDTQQSIQTAKGVAEAVTGVDTRSLDMTYSIDANNISLVGGPSAGAALAVATIAALEGKQPSKGVMITGTIGDDGAVGQVGGVLEKARAAKNAGARVFLVPPNQSTETYTHPVESCIKETGFIFCETTYKKKVVSIGEEVGLDVKEITNIRDALPYFF